MIIQKRAIYLDGMIIGELTLYNSTGLPRWFVNIVSMDEDNGYAIEDNSEHSLFSNPLAVGPTPEAALCNFLSVEDELINSL